MPDLSVKPQRTPAGRSRSKSYTQFLVSAQRPLPFSAQSTSNGSSSRGSPKGTIACAKRALTWRTPLTSPCGEKNSTGCAQSEDIHAAQSDSSTFKAHAFIHTPLCLEGDQTISDSITAGPCGARAAAKRQAGEGLWRCLGGGLCTRLPC